MLFNHTPIQMEWFYYLEGDRTKLNWFLMEVALELYDKKTDCLISRHYVRRLRESLLKRVRGQRKSRVVYHERIADFYPRHSNQRNGALGKVAKEALDHMLSARENCPAMCLGDYKSRSMDFDLYKD
jgi:hypothetical protein